MPTPIDRAYIELVGDFKNFTSGLKSNVGKSVKGVEKDLDGITTSTTKSVNRATKEHEGMFSSLKENAKGALEVVGAYEVASKATQFFKSAIEAGREAQKTTAQTAAVIKSTGSAAHVTAKDVEELASSISRKTGIDDDQIKSNENMLLTFTGIRNEVGKGNDIFNQATKTVGDMSVALGQSGKSSAIQLGKALNDPIKGITALRRVGVAFTTDQQKTITSLVNSGHTLDAQKIILGELNKEFGGSAVAQATAGDKMRASWKVMKEELGTKLLPALDAVENFIANKFIPVLFTLGGWIDTKVIPPIKNFAGIVKTYVSPILSEIVDRVKAFIANLTSSGGAISKATGPIKSAFSSLGTIVGIVFSTLKTYFETIVPVVMKFYSTLITQLLPSLEHIVTTIASGVIPIIKSLTNTFTTYILPAIISIYTWMQAHLIPIFVQFVKIISTYVIPIIVSIAQWIATKLIPVILQVAIAVGSRLKPVFDALAKFIQTNVLPALVILLKKFNEWKPTIEAVIIVVVKVIGKILEFAATILGKVLPPLIRFVGYLLVGAVKTLILVITTIARVIKAFVNFGIGVYNAFKAVYTFFRNLPSTIQSAIGSLGSLLSSKGKALIDGLWGGIKTGWTTVSNWFSGIGSRIAGYFKGFGSLLVSRGTNLINGLWSGISRGWSTIRNWFTNIGSRFKGYLSGASTWLKQNGRDIVSGLFSGILNELGNVASWVKSHIFNPIKNAVVNLFKISSPSKVMMDLGGHKIGGFIKGMLLHDPAALAKNLVGSIPKVLESIVKKGLVKVSDLSKKGLEALQSTGYDIGASGLGKLGLGGGSGDQRAHSQGAAANQAYAKSVLNHFGWDQSQFSALVSLWNGESGWNQNAANPTSSAYGIAQFLDSTWAGMPYGKTNDPNKQIIDGLTYIKRAYGSPASAYSAWLSRSPHWYAKGGDPNAGSWGVVGDAGPELVHFKGGAHVYDNKTSARMLKQMASIATYATGGDVKGAVTSGTRDTAKSLSTKLNAEISLSTSRADIAKFTQQIFDEIHKAKYSKKQSDFLINYVKQAESDAVAAQRSERTASGKHILDVILSAFTGSRARGSIKAAAESVTQSIGKDFSGSAQSRLVATVSRVNGQMQRLAAQRDKIAAQISAANAVATSVKDEALSSASLSSIGTVSSASNLDTSLKSKLAAILAFTANLKKLSKLGLSKDLIAQITGEGVDAGGATAAALASGSKATIKDINKTQRAINSASKTLGNTAVNAQIGGNIAKSFVNGLKSQSASLEKQMTQLGKVLAKSVGKAFHLKGYAKGAWQVPQTELALVHKDEMIIPATQATSIRNSSTSNSSYTSIDYEKLGMAVARNISKISFNAHLDSNGVITMVSKGQIAKAVRGSRL